MLRECSVVLAESNVQRTTMCMTNITCRADCLAPGSAPTPMLDLLVWEYLYF